MYAKFRDRVSVVAPFKDDGRTKQADKDRTDIRNIVKAAKRRGGLVSGVHVAEGTFMDLTQVPDYVSMLNTVAQVQFMFDSLPASLRDRFNNDPHKMIAFVDDPNNKDEAIKLGLIKKPAEPPAPPEPISVRVVSDKPTA